MAKPRGVTARVRWRSQRDPSWEIETRHEGFRLAEDAALFANGFVTRSPAFLVLKKGRLDLEFTDGTTTEMRSGKFQIWRLPDGFDRSKAADDISFERVDAPLQALTALGLDGPWAQLAYGVVGPDGEVIDVVLDVDETGDLKVITVEEPPPNGIEEVASFSLGVLPKA